ncbi:MAG: bile acid:sodium symporter family protein [Phenylobacterium sp.]|uniref:bile acid:sodium symporter family protein n=1 Tax=Phenylobacterium sp. TaxID=1871053 RepID=UPI002733D5C6|nr:bile acid:sodium symporter family protein [Phenylobacterium sp.]MDP3748673.1 bile acid:sodium symporter family protein [Phenylobacterium sp.]
MIRGVLKNLGLDWYIAAIVGMVVLASILPARGEAAPVVATATKFGIALVFFLHGAKLSPDAVIKGLLHWRLHGLVLVTTFILWPLTGLGAAALPSWVLPAALAPGVVFLACLPSTIQSQIGFTAIARGNVAAAVCGASASNLIGMVATPVMAGVLLGAQGEGVSLASLQAILLQLLAPFLAGQLLRPWVAGFIQRHAKPFGLVDRGSILLVVYNAFSGAVVAGIWNQVTALDLARIMLICVVLLAMSLGFMVWVARTRGFSTEDEIAIVFGGSNKSLAAGVPMAGVLFPAATVGFILLPLMLYHQFQLITCAALAQRYAKRVPA